MSIALQYGLALFWMVIIPFLTGGIFVKKLSCNERFFMISCLGTGLITIYAWYQIPAMILVKIDGSFRSLTWIFIAGSLLLAVLGSWQWLSFFIKKHNEQKQKDSSVTDLKRNMLYKNRYFWIGVVLIIVQIGTILWMATPDSDDAFYTGLSSMSLSYDYILKYNAYDGLMQKAISKRYIMAGLPAYQASLSLMCKRLHTLIICHNLYPLFYMPLAYGLYCRLADRWLKKKEQMGIFLMFLAFLHMFGNYFVFSAENFLITRIWQGKALFVTIGLPYIYDAISRAWDEEGFKQALPYWIMTALGLCACAFMGETGLYLGMVVTFLAALSNAAAKKKYRNIIYAGICCTPQIILLAAFLL